MAMADKDNILRRSGASESVFNFAPSLVRLVSGDRDLWDPSWTRVYKTHGQNWPPKGPTLDSLFDTYSGSKDLI